MAHRTFSMIILLVGVVAMGATGCSSTSSAPFHMYSSPLLEGETESAPGVEPPNADDASAPGVEPRQVYAYRRWNSGETTRPTAPPRRTASTNQGTFDVVDAPSEPVLASNAGDTSGSGATGAGTASSDTGSSPDAPTRTVEERSETDQLEESEATGDEGDYDGRDGRTPSTAAAGYIHAVLSANDVELDDRTSESIPRLYRSCRTDGETFHSRPPNIGDLVFFHNTYDANGDGRNNDWYTLVGIIEQVRSDGTVVFLAHRGDGVETLHLNLDRLDESTNTDGQRLNSRLREDSPDDPPFTQHLAGQLFAGYCDILGDRPDLVLIDQWSP